MKKNRTWELCGAVIGAGFASGQELVAFFTRHGIHSWLGIALAVLTMGLICWRILGHPGLAGMPEAWQGKLLGKVWQGMFLCLLISTGGAMLAGGGEIAALLLPIPGARWLGLAITACLTWMLSGGASALLARVSQGLVLCLAAAVCLGFTLPVRAGASLAETSGMEAALHGLCYGGFNMALACPVAALAGKEMNVPQRQRCAVGFALVMGVMLCLGNGVLMRQQALLGEELPLVRMLSAWGRPGFLLGGAALYLASLTTLTACVRGIRAIAPRCVWLGTAAIVALSMGGLEAIVGRVYPALGGGCLVLLMMAQTANETKP